MHLTLDLSIWHASFRWLQTLYQSVRVANGGGGGCAFITKRFLLFFCCCFFVYFLVEYQHNDDDEPTIGHPQN